MKVIRTNLLIVIIYKLNVSKCFMISNGFIE